MPISLRSVLLPLAACAALALSLPAHAQFTFVLGDGGKRIDGSGRATDEARVVGAFNGLVVRGPVDVKLTAGSSEKVVVHADDNIVGLIEIEVKDGKLVVGIKSGVSLRTRSQPYVRVEFREMNSVAVRGSGDVHADRIKAPVFETTISGSGDVLVDEIESDAVALSISGSGDFGIGGRAGKLGVVIVGSGDVRAEKLQVRDAAIRIRGSGDARVYATESLQVDIAGSGDVRYRGEPKVTKKIAGSGEVSPLR